MPYKVLVDDNFRYMDEEARYELGTYKTESEARGACVELVYSALKELFSPGISADRLYRRYILFGPDPFIVGGDPTSDFSAWDYAKRRCAENEAADRGVIAHE
jgi:hypothetical protein